MYHQYNIVLLTGEPVVQKEESENERQAKEHTNKYTRACKLLGIVPVNYLSKHINDKSLVMKSHPLGPKGTRAVCIALVVSNPALFR